MIDSKFNGHGSANPGAGLRSYDKQQLEKETLRDLQNDNRIIIPRPLGNPHFPHDRGSFMEGGMVSGMKRLATEYPQSPMYNQSQISSGANGHLVYARRKSEHELLHKSNNYEKDKNDDGAPKEHEVQESPQQEAQSESTKRSCFSAFTPVAMASQLSTSEGQSPLAKPLDGLSSGEQICGTNTAEVSHPRNLRGTSDQHWKERFLQLQTHLRNCDHSSRQDYIKMLHSLTPVGRSRHAVDLEKRAIQLILEEGHEIARMKQLNVLGKSVAMNSVSPLIRQSQMEN